MKLIKDLYHPELSMLPIGGFYTMGPREAALAAQFLEPKAILPIHFGTFPPLTGTPDELEKHLKESIEVIRVCARRINLIRYEKTAGKTPAVLL